MIDFFLPRNNECRLNVSSLFKSSSKYLTKSCFEAILGEPIPKGLEGSCLVRLFVKNMAYILLRLS